MAQPRHVPWTDTHEWLAVYHWLYGRDAFHQPTSLQEADAYRMKGIHRVEAWRSRGRVPPAIDSTATLVAALLSLDDAPWRQQVLRMELAMSFVRFVNDILDTAQKGTVAQSLGMLANQVQLPGWFVELRNAATHGKELPTLALLIGGCRQALVWLEAHYWTLEMERVASNSIKLQRHIVAYRERRTASLKTLMAKKFKGTAKEQDDCADIRALIRDGKQISDCVALTCRVLVEPGNLIPDKIMDAQLASNVQIPGEWCTFWLPALKLFHQEWKGFYNSLFKHIITRLSGPASRDFGLLAGWARYFHRNHKTTEMDECLAECLMRNSNSWLRSIDANVKPVDPLDQFKEVRSSQVTSWTVLSDWTPVPIGHTKHDLTLDPSLNDAKVALERGVLVQAKLFEATHIEPHIEPTEEAFVESDDIQEDESEDIQGDEVNIELV